MCKWNLPARWLVLSLSRGAFHETFSELFLHVLDVLTFPVSFLFDRPLMPVRRRVRSVAVVLVFVGRLDIIRLSIAGRLLVGRLVIRVHFVVAPVRHVVVPIRLHRVLVIVSVRLLGVIVVVSVRLLGVVESWRRFIVIGRPLVRPVAADLVIVRLSVAGVPVGWLLISALFVAASVRLD